MSQRERIERRIRPSVLAGRAYRVPDAEGLIKLDAMENPYPWPDDMKQGWLEMLASVDFNRYPDTAGEAVKEELRRAFRIPADASLLIGNGSDEIIQIIVTAIARQGAVVLAPDPSFAMYRIITDAMDLRFAGVPLREGDFSLDTDAMLAAIAKHDPAVVFIAWPNNPTGGLFDAGALDAIIRAAGGLVVIDEAYHAFAGASFMEQVCRHENLVVMRTLSKLGLAGLRFGFLAGPPAWLDEFEKLRLPYNVSVLAQAGVRYALGHLDVLEDQAARIRNDREEMYRALSAMEGIQVWPSAANFLMIRVNGMPGTDVFDALRGEGILIKNLHGSHPMLSDCLRVTVGDPAQNRAFRDSLSRILS